MGKPRNQRKGEAHGNEVRKQEERANRGTVEMRAKGMGGYPCPTSAFRHLPCAYCHLWDSS